MTQRDNDCAKNSCTGGLAVRRVQRALDQIIDISIPFHLKAIERHKELIEQYRQNQEWDHLLKEQINGLQSVKRLKADLRELESLGTKVNASDHQLVCQRIFAIKSTVCSVVEQFIESNHDLTNPLISLDLNNGQNSSDDNPMDRRAGIECENSVSNPDSMLELRSELSDRKHTLISWLNLRKELSDLNDMFNTIISTLTGQRERVNSIEEHINEAHEDVVVGAQHLSKASALKSAFVPVTAGLLGGAVFGPIGMLTGFKVCGVVSAIGASIIGYSGVKLIQNKSIASEEFEFISNEEKKICQKKSE